MWSNSLFIAYCAEMVCALISIMGFAIWISESPDQTERNRRMRFQNIYLIVAAIVIILTLTAAIITKTYNV